MNTSELTVALPLLGSLAMNVVVTAGLTSWGRWVARRQGGTRGWRALVWAPIGAFAAVSLGIVLTGVGLLRAFRDVAGADPAEKASLLSAGISDAMTATAVLAPISLLLSIVSVVAFLIGSFRPPAGAGE